MAIPAVRWQTLVGTSDYYNVETLCSRDAHAKMMLKGKIPRTTDAGGSITMLHPELICCDKEG